MFKQGPPELRSGFGCLSAYSCTQRVSFPPFWLHYPFTALAIFSWPLGYVVHDMVSSLTLQLQHPLQLPLLKLLEKSLRPPVFTHTKARRVLIPYPCESGPWRLPKGTILTSNLFASFLFFSLIMCDWHQARYFLALSHSVLTTTL